MLKNFCVPTYLTLSQATWTIHSQFTIHNSQLNPCPHLQSYLPPI